MIDHPAPFQNLGEAGAADRKPAKEARLRHGMVEMSGQDRPMMKRGFDIVWILALAALLAGCDNTPPSDQQMIDLFKAQRSAFEEIRMRICEKTRRDGLEADIGSAQEILRSQVVMMDPEWSRPMVSDAERGRYYALFEQIDAKGVQAVVDANNQCEVSIEYWSVGWAGDADYKKFVFGAPQHREQIVDSLDDAQMGTEIVFYRRRLEAGWWLALQHWP
ncbi:hypothetical protein AAFN88_03045 [Pelagibius sp. CAU 1746]|uniref:hypothetical protein n=1 Tax=Pelagibius sp. CAU 1746 TaxID=3140370 RepID=UPI00325B8493